MHDKGFVRMATVTPLLKVADCKYNTSQIIDTLKEAIEKDVELVLYPELCISGYTCGDLFFQDALIKECEKSIIEICRFLKDIEIFVVVSAPIHLMGRLFNCAIAINKGKIVGMVPKSYLPNNNEFSEKRWFTSGLQIKDNQKISYAGQDVLFGRDILFKHKNFQELIVGIEICEDLWANIPPSSFYAQVGATVMLNPSTSTEAVGKSDYRRNLVKGQSSKCILAYTYASSGFGESTTDSVFSGQSFICENGYLLAESPRFSLSNTITIADVDIQSILHDRLKSTAFKEHLHHEGTDYDYMEFETYDKDHELMRNISPSPFVPRDASERAKACEEIFNIQSFGLGKRIRHIGNPTMVIGISGGLDSTLALLVCIHTCDLLKMDRKKILAVTMPGFGTTGRTYDNALTLMKNLGVSIKEISIKEASMQHFKDIGHDPDIHDITYENTQARERTQILMDLANKHGGMVIGTGNLSELALGWATYNGDHMSMYAVNSGIPKTLIKHLVKWIADHQVSGNAKNALYDILNTPISPELLPPDQEGNIAQETEKIVGPYELHDFFLFYMVRHGCSPSKIYYLATIAFQEKYNKDFILKWLKNFYKRFFSQQFKRSCLPDGPKVGSVNLSPRGSWKMPSDASYEVWMREVEGLEGMEKY